MGKTKFFDFYGLKTLSISPPDGEIGNERDIELL
jgi:hypothetical protein